MAVRVEVKQDKDGIWYCRPYMGRDALGKTYRPYARFPMAKSREEAQAMAETWAANLTANGTVKSARLSDLLADYVGMLSRNGASPNSIKSYRGHAKKAARYLRNAVAGKLTVLDCTNFEQALLTAKEDGGAGLSRNTVLNVHHFMRGAFNHFVGAGICESNPFLYVNPPSPERYEAPVLDEWDFPELDGELERLVLGEVTTKQQAKRATYAFAAWLAVRTGFRCGEACGIRRRDVSFTASRIHIGGNVIEEAGKKPYRRAVTKGKRGRNVSVTPEDMAVIRRFMEIQYAAFGRFPADAPLLTFDGSWLRPTTVSREFTRIRKRLGLPERLTYHSLRHTHATWCLVNGCDIKTLSERLGHADVATTLRIYAHVIEGRDSALARTMHDAIENAKRGVPKV